MDCFISKIFNNKIDFIVHLQFQKFSRGTFDNRALIKATASAKGYTLLTGHEFANELVRAAAEKLGNEKTSISGVVVSTIDLKSKIPHISIKQFMGIKQYVIESEMSGQDIVNLIDSVPEAFFALSFNAGDTILKIKPKAPKSAKPSTSEKGPKVNFCSLKTTDNSLIEALIFEKGWKKIEINHTFMIKDIEIPADAKTPEEMRKLAKRKGTIIRKLVIDGHQSIKEKDFAA